MKLTLKTQQMEMRTSFSEVHIRIDNLSSQLDAHRKETAFNFRQMDKRFEKVDQQFDKLDSRIDKLEHSINKMPSEIANALSPYLAAIETMLENHR